MPLYEYECDACDHRFEVIQKFSDPPVATCPKCGGGVHKVQSAPAFQFKGSGWYITDYAKKKDGAAAEEKTDAKGDAKTDAKTETKAEAKTGETKTEVKTEAKKTETKTT